MIASNNRFLQRVNPEITRALADSGSSLEHSEIQQLMRQMVDLGIADNLKLWVHSGLVKTRTSGSDTFVPKAYDISGEENDGVQATEANQPKLVSDGMEFDGSNDYLGEVNAHRLQGDFSVMCWVQLYVVDGETANETDNPIVDNGSGGRGWTFWSKEGHLYLSIRIFNSGSSGGSTWYTNDWENAATLNINTWYHACFVRSGSNMLTYLNGTLNQTTAATSGTIEYTMPFRIMSRYHDTVSRFSEGKSNDIRIFNTALSATEITAIFNATKSKYGIT